MPERPFPLLAVVFLNTFLRSNFYELFGLLADIDECTSKPNICGDGNQCKNIIGGHVCSCNTGYESTPDGKACVGWYRLSVCSVEFLVKI